MKIQLRDANNFVVFCQSDKCLKTDSNASKSIQRKKNYTRNL